MNETHQQGIDREIRLVSYKAVVDADPPTEVVGEELGLCIAAYFGLLQHLVGLGDGFFKTQEGHELEFAAKVILALPLWLNAES